MKRKFLDLLREANQKLIDFNCGISIEQKGKRLYLRGTLPPKPDSEKKNPHQQYVSLGIYANPAGLKCAVNEAKKVGVLNGAGAFDWSPYLRKKQRRSPDDPKEAIARFENHYFSERAKTKTKLQTFQHEYQRVLEKLPGLTVPEMRQLILSTKPDTRNRRRHAIAMACFADYLGLEHDFRSLVGKYSVRKIMPKDIPSEKLIAESFDRMENAAWLWAIALQACYGLRNHEIFYADVSRFPLLQVLDGKTGSRTVFPFYLEWAEKYKLDAPVVPDCTGQTNSDLGSRVTHAYKRAGIKFNPYALRHAWAVRSIKFGLHPTLAAQQMGHSPTTHYQHYQNWIDADVHTAEFYRVMAKSDRPMPPT